jgi:hypothetical protein
VSQAKIHTQKEQFTSSGGVSSFEVSKAYSAGIEVICHRGFGAAPRSHQ